MVEGNNGMQISNALAGQRASKKRAQDDVKLLANRIALLKLEEKKVSQAMQSSHTLSDTCHFFRFFTSIGQPILGLQ